MFVSGLPWPSLLQTVPKQTDNQSFRGLLAEGRIALRMLAVGLEKELGKASM